MFSIIEQLKAYHGEVQHIADPKGGRIYKIDMTVEEAHAKQDKFKKELTELEQKTLDNYAEAYAWVKKQDKTLRFSYANIAQEIGIAYPVAKKILVKLLLGRHIFKDGKMGEHDAYKRS